MLPPTIPIFPLRAFHHGAILHNTKAGISRPKDLEGRKVGVNRGYTVTTGVWARGVLQDEHGVNLSKITWVLSGDEHVAEYRPPPNVTAIEPGRTLEELLASGEIAAAIGIKVDSPDVKPLIPDAVEAGYDALRRRGLYPINHTIVVKNELLETSPDLAGDIFTAFADARRLYVERLKAGQLDDADPVHLRVMQLTGDPLPYGVEANQQNLEAIVQYCVEQEILPRPFALEELFPANTLGLNSR